MYRNKKRLWCLLPIFFVFIVTSAVYAAVTNSVSISGEVTLENPAMLWLEYPSNSVLTTSSENGSGSGAITISQDGQTATVEVTLTEPGDSVTLFYNVYNVGYTNAKIVSCTMGEQPTFGGAYAYNFSGAHDTISGQILAPGAKIQNCEIKVEWSSGIDASVNGIFNFDIQINYEYTTEPATVTS